ncbi:MAG: CHAT domain-containing protein, partial [Gemmataceae bacterium]|nr:CHAT domain-containing protein [Gemmataceae bacterium]
DRLTGPDGERLRAREAEARRAVSRLRSQAMLMTTEQAEQPAGKALLAQLEAAQKEYADAWREINNADPLTRVLTNQGFADAAVARVRNEAHKSGGVVLVYMVGRDASFAVLSTDPGAAPQVFTLGIDRTISTDLGPPPANDRLASAGFRGITLKPTAQPDRPAPTPTAVEGVALTDGVATKLANHYLQQLANPGFTPTRGIALASRSPKTAPRPSAPELLGDAILPPPLVAKIKASGAKRLILVPDGPLHKLPFEALLVSGAGGPRYALDELPAVCYAPSLAVLGVVLGRPRDLTGPDTLLTVGDPAYPETPTGASTALPRLPYTAQESKRIRQFFPSERVTAFEGANATELNVVKALPGKRFVHLAAHGFADEAFGNAFAAIALTPGPGGREDSNNDGFLTLHEISRLKLAGCELTVLSACVTNVGPQRPLEAGVTLAGAFLGAGSRGVMASCWSVDDQATAELMSAFFAAVRPEKGKGIAYADALRNARQAIRKRPGWEAPFYWAPFVYVGPPD